MCKPHKVNGAKQGRHGRVGLEKQSEVRKAIEYLTGDRYEQDKE
jgi:hypothetical protein